MDSAECDISNYGTVELEMHTFDERNVQEKNINLERNICMLTPTLFASKLKPQDMLNNSKVFGQVSPLMGSKNLNAKSIEGSKEMVANGFNTVKPNNIQSPRPLESHEISSISNIEHLR